jgi:hypothetical protein
VRERLTAARCFAVAGARRRSFSIPLADPIIDPCIAEGAPKLLAGNRDSAASILMSGKFPSCELTRELSSRSLSPLEDSRFSSGCSLDGNDARDTGVSAQQRRGFSAASPLRQRVLRRGNGVRGSTYISGRELTLVGGASAYPGTCRITEWSLFGHLRSSRRLSQTDFRSMSQLPRRFGRRCFGLAIDWRVRHLTRRQREADRLSASI